jgi:hypothetical protein
VDRDGVARTGQRTRDRPPDSLTRAGNERGAAIAFTPGHGSYASLFIIPRASFPVQPIHEMAAVSPASGQAEAAVNELLSVASKRADLCLPVKGPILLKL